MVRVRALASAMADPAPSRRPTDWPEVVLALGLIAGLVAVLMLEVETAGVPDPLGPLEGQGKRVAEWVSFAAEALAALVIGLGTLRTAWEVARAFFSPGPLDALGDIRLRLGRVLTLGLELTLASDVLQTAFAPTRSEILTLGAVVLLRTLLNLFLEREIRNAEPAPAAPQ